MVILSFHGACKNIEIEEYKKTFKVKMKIRKKDTTHLTTQTIQ